MSSPVSFAVHDGVAVVTVDHPPVNAISHAVRVGLLAAAERITRAPGLVGAVVAAAGRTFMAGSDIREFDAPPQPPRLAEVVAALEALPLPVVAAIHGTALGGGFEVALGCHARIARADARVGLPEINLGLIPGAGGTQRLPRLIGAERALDWITTGRHVTAPEALAAGAVDAVVADDVLAAAVAKARALAQSGAWWRTSSDRPVPAPPAGFFQSRRAALERRGHDIEAALAALAAVAAAATQPFAAGLELEAGHSARLKASTQSRAKRHLFFAEREVTRIPDIPAATPLRPVQTVGVVGAGTMGRGIAAACLAAGLRVVWLDRSAADVARGVDVLDAIFHRDVEKQRLTAEGLTARLAALTPTVDLDALAAVDLVIEAVVEDMAVKQQLFRRLDRVCKPGAILATNTSTLDIDRIAAATARPQDVLGLHFFAPAHVMRLLEVVRGAATAPDAVATAMDVGRRLGKVAVLAGVCFGFIGNRMFEGYIREAQMLLLEGASPAQVDRALVAFGMAMGPCAVIDLAGVDVSYLTRQGNRANLPPDPRYCAVGDALYRLGRYGRKTGRGFYRYHDGAPADDLEVGELIAAEARRLGVVRRAPDEAEIVARCLYPVIDEGLRILAEGIALRPADIDVVWTAGYGFPRWRGGPMFHADVLGLASVAAGMADLAAALGNAFGYWTPSPLLATLAAEGRPISTWRRTP